MLCRSGYRVASTAKMERFVIIVNGIQSLNIMTKRSILDVAAALDPLLICLELRLKFLLPYSLMTNTINRTGRGRADKCNRL